MPEEQNLNDSAADTLEQDLWATLKQEPMESDTREMLAYIQKLKHLPKVQASLGFEATLRQKIDKLPLKRPLWVSKIFWPAGIAAVMVIALIFFRPMHLPPDQITQDMLSLNHSAFQDELLHINLSHAKSEIGLSLLKLQSPASQINQEPHLLL